MDPAPSSDLSPPSRWTLPEGAVDSHAHVIGGHYIANRSYEPHPATPDEYIAMLDKVGMTYGVLVQVSVLGTDNSLMVTTLKQHPDRLRGIAVISADIGDHELRSLKAAGVVGLRLNTLTSGGIGFEEWGRYESICAEMDWHLQILTPPTSLSALVETVGRSRVPVVFDHMGQVQSDTTDRAAENALLEMVRSGAWVKLSGAFRLTQHGAPYENTVRFGRSLYASAPDRCVWGSDWPHVHFTEPMPKISKLLDLLVEWIPDEAGRIKVMSTNPRQLYGFV